MFLQTFLARFKKGDVLSVKAKLSVTPLSSKISTSICRNNNNNNNNKVDGRIIIIIIIKDNMLIANTRQQEK